MNNTTYSKVRTDIVNYLKDELLGPRNGYQEFLTEPPFSKYTVGILYPIDQSATLASSGSLMEEDEDAEGNAGTASDDQTDDPIILANQTLPSSLGISFYLRFSSTVKLRVTGARYEETEGNSNGEDVKGWQRKEFDTGELLSKPNSHERVVTQSIPIFDNTADLHLIWRKTGTEGWIVTATVINKLKQEGVLKPQECLHQAKIHCHSVNPGKISAYPRHRLLTDDREEHLLDILYRDQAAYGIGHGCSVDWEQPQDKVTEHIWSEYLPTYSVPPMRYDIEDDLLMELLGNEYDSSFHKVLNFHFLSEGETNKPAIVKRLKQFVMAYELWIKNKVQADNNDIADDLVKEKEELLSRLNAAVTRMTRGVNLLEHDDTVFKAFCLANKAMLLQRIHTGEEYAGSRHSVKNYKYKAPDLIVHRDNHDWRPFQLAFQLLTISSIAFEEDPDRSIVDLIWFPTGGGKTEAYLAVTAFLIFYRRMMHGEQGFGTTVLMRYTLRLLTSQQFQRAASLLCACEYLRRSSPDELGREEISIGLWVGGSTTPNSFQDAYDEYEKLLREDHPLSPYQIDRCPWCGTEIVPKSRDDDTDLYGIRSTQTEFYIFCPNSTCPFHDGLPTKVVDDQLYQAPPTLLLATVDKFARMPWEERISVFFGSGNHRPPELIIQDELHLISGPLGTMVGLYETAIDTLIELNGVTPKIIASTATIRKADEQTIGLYGRNAKLFPPSGLRANDSYFARFDENSAGRLFVGVLGQGHTSSTTMIRICAALLQAPIDLGLTKDELDAYFTLVAYHNSLRELGKTLTFASDDIPARIQVIARDHDNLRDLSEDKVAELTSNVDARELGNVLDRLNKKAEEGNSIGILACTNMLSVGVDVPRLGLMTVIGQPKSTSEYIQSTSRVGRSYVPGLVVCMYSPSKPRDRSHYERFVAYHSALYREVEPTSVTSFSAPARQRALHAVLVSLVRHNIGLAGNKDAGKFSLSDLQSDLDVIINMILERVRAVDPMEVTATEEEIKDLLSEWQSHTTGKLYYDTKHRAKKSLLKQWGSSTDGVWNTLNSMRNVDQSALVKSRDSKRFKNEQN